VGWEVADICGYAREDMRKDTREYRHCCFPSEKENTMTVTPSVDDAHRRPAGTSDITIKALGKLSEALEVVDNARGQLYSFHRLSGKADLALGEAVDLMREAGHTDIADRLEKVMVGRNVIEGRWTFQIVEDYDDNYYAAFAEEEKKARDELVAGKKHIFEAEMKEDRRTHGKRHHEATPHES
jgi:hypothetical protein